MRSLVRLSFSFFLVLSFQGFLVGAECPGDTLETIIQKLTPGKKTEKRLKKLCRTTALIFCASFRHIKKDLTLILKAPEDDHDSHQIEKQLLYSLLTGALPKTKAVPGSCFWGREFYISHSITSKP